MTNNMKKWLTSAVEKCRIKQDNFFDLSNWQRINKFVILSAGNSLDIHTVLY